MGVFSFIETFFFISLAITFILILLLVNHFKQRLNVIENKYDTLFEITNSLLQELGNFKSYMMAGFNNRGPPSMPMHHPSVISKSTPEVSVQHMDTADKAAFFPSKNDKIVVSDNDDNTTGEDDGDDEGSYDGDDSTTDSENDDDDESEMAINGDFDKDDDADDADNGFQDSGIAESKIKIVNMDIQESLVVDSLKDDLDSVENLEEIVESLKLSEDKPTIHIEKLEDVTEEENPVLEKNPDNENKDVYSKMSVNELKKVVITMGLCSDASKLKKYDLLKLLKVI